MFDILSKYQASIFLKASEIVPSADVVSNLLNMFRDRNLLPTTFTEIGSRGIVPHARLRLNSENNEWGINFASHRIDIEKNPTVAGGKNLGDVRVFAEEATEFFGRILRDFKKKGHRLTIITSNMLREMHHEQLDAVYRKLFRPLPFYTRAVPFEWNSRTVAKSSINIANEAELINVITAINRERGQLTERTSVSQFDRITVSFDINTVAEKDENRFSAESFEEFFEGALNNRDGVIEEIRGMIDG